MSIAKLSLTLNAWLIIFLLAVSSGLAQGPLPQSAPPVSPPDFVPGEILVKFQPYVGLIGAQGSLRSEGLRPLEISPRSGLVRVQVEPGREAETIATLLARGDIDFATPNYIVQALGDPNDPEYWQQWSLNQFSDHDIDAPEAWDLDTGGDSITIAIIDTGIDLDHPDLQAKITSGYDFVNDDNSPDDDHFLSHGTHVAGIAAAIGNNGLGIAGVSWGARLMPLKVLNSFGSGSTFDVAQAIYYAVDNGAQIINMSLGVQNSQWPCSMSAIEDAFNYAASHDVLVVVASGNDGQNGVNCPAAYDQVMAVGSTTSSDTRSSFSNYGPRLDIVAPGSTIYSTISGGYGYLSGTSMATPHVAGLAALIRSFDPSLSDNQVREVIQNTADDLGPAGWDQEYGYGRINAWRALESISLRSAPDQLSLFIDDDSGPAYGILQLMSANPDVITWTATISPSVSWLDLAPSASGLIASASSLDITLTATRPVTYNTYTTSILITGTTTSGFEVQPKTTEIRLYYLPHIYQYRFPLLLKN